MGAAVEEFSRVDVVAFPGEAGEGSSKKRKSDDTDSPAVKKAKNSAANKTSKTLAKGFLLILLSFIGSEFLWAR